VIERIGQNRAAAARSPGVDAPVEVRWRHRLRFTSDAFDPANATLRDVIAEAGEGPARTVVFVDSGVADATPGLLDWINAYAAARDDVIDLAASPEIVPGGEQAKNDRTVVDRVAQVIHDRGICRHSFVIAVGGGAVLDAVGFAAAVAHRGVRLVRLPTTTLAQDDSGVGVKNGVNAFGKKNFLGAFTPPWAVINDIRFLKTLSDRDWRSGFSEAVKVALVKDGAFFDEIESTAPHIRARDLDAAEPVIRRSALLHLDHIATGGDPFELTEARPLDFGHWSAHKLEQMSSFELTHGEAVAIGIAIDATYSMLAGWLDETAHGRILRVLRDLGFEFDHPALDEVETLLEGVDEFREHLGGRLTVAMLRDAGEMFDVHEIDPSLVVRAIELVRDAPAPKRFPAEQIGPVNPRMRESTNGRRHVNLPRTA